MLLWSDLWKGGCTLLNFLLHLKTKSKCFYLASTSHPFPVCVLARAFQLNPLSFKLLLPAWFCSPLLMPSHNAGGVLFFVLFFFLFMPRILLPSCCCLLVFHLQPCRWTCFSPLLPASYFHWSLYWISSPTFTCNAFCMQHLPPG